MNEDELRERALESLNRKRTLDIAFTATVVALIALVAIWALTGTGYFWPGWAMLVAVLGFTAVGLVRTSANRTFNDATVEYEMARIAGVPPPGRQR